MFKKLLSALGRIIQAAIEKVSGPPEWQGHRPPDRED